MKCHIGVDVGSGLVHTITVTAANEHDITQTAKLLREDDEAVYGDSGYQRCQNQWKNEFGDVSSAFNNQIGKTQ